MTNYRRLFTPNATYFFTLVTFKRQRIFLNASAREMLKHSIQTIQSRMPFEIVAFVLLPEHLHTLWLLPEEDVNYSTRIRLIKEKFTKSYYAVHQSNIALPKSLAAKNEKGIWQRRFWEHCIRDERDLWNHMNYIHYNPVKHGHVKSPCDWEYSSFHKYVKMEWYEANWGAAELIGIEEMD